MTSWKPVKAGETAKFRRLGKIVSLYIGDTETHSAPVTLSDGNTYSVELEMTLEHR